MIIYCLRYQMIYLILLDAVLTNLRMYFFAFSWQNNFHFEGRFRFWSFWQLAITRRIEVIRFINILRARYFGFSFLGKDLPLVEVVSISGFRLTFVLRTLFKYVLFFSSLENSTNLKVFPPCLMLTVDTSGSWKSAKILEFDT